jgi:hypothetical protein
LFAGIRPRVCAPPSQQTPSRSQRRALTGVVIAKPSVIIDALHTTPMMASLMVVVALGVALTEAVAREVVRG